jgi:hypothetical protein
MDVIEQVQQVSTEETAQEVNMTETLPQDTNSIEQQTEQVSKEEEEARETLNALEKLPTLMEKVCITISRTRDVYLTFLFRV